MNAIKIFIYPIVNIKHNLTGNPYIDDLIQALEQNEFLIINKSDDSRVGVLSIFKYFINTDFFYFNWIENLPEKKFGFLQIIIFIFQLFFIKIFNKKIIWTLHNLDSHYKISIFYKLIQKLMLKYSNIIIIHTRETTEFLETNRVKKSNIFYFFHPFQSKHNSNKSTDKKNGVLIWGAMNAYKGVFEFLEFHKNNELNFTVQLAGSFSDELYLQKVKSVSSAKVTILNSYILNEDLARLHENSLFVLFPYNSKSVLNSGSLNFSLVHGSKIIGPNIGAFKELGDLKIIHTYENYFDIVKILNSKIEINIDGTNKFIYNNSWYNFGFELKKMIEGLK